MPLKNETKIVDLNALAFYQGAHDVPLDEMLDEIGSAHDKDRARAEEKSLHRQKPLEATIAELEARKGSVDRAWEDALRRSGHHPPAIVTAALIAFLGLAALVVDAVLLGPGLDALGIGDPVLQIVAAFGLAALSSAIFHLAHETFERNPLSFEAKVIWRSLGGIAVFGLLSWGVLRAYQLQFAAHLNQNPLSEFLGAHGMLAPIFIAFITLAAPLVGAAAIHFAAPRLAEWRGWRRARRDRDTLHKDLAVNRGKLELERTALDRQLAQLHAQEVGWRAMAAQYHERGLRHGARQSPHWLVLLKASLWGLGGLVAGCVLGTFLAPLYFALPLGAWATAFLHYRRQRFHPTYDQFQRQENTRFRVSTARPQIIPPPNPRLRAGVMEDRR